MLLLMLLIMANIYCDKANVFNLNSYFADITEIETPEQSSHSIS